MKKNVSGQKIGTQMIATDGSEFTGTVTVYVTLDAATQAIGTVGSGVCTHEGHGYHTYAPSQAETNGDLCAYTFVGTGASTQTVQVEPNFPQTGDSFARLGAPAVTTVSADVAAIKAQTASIQSDTDDIQTRIPTVLTAAGHMKADALAIDGDLSAATRLKRGALASVLVTIGTGSTVSSFVTSSMDPAVVATDQFRDRSFVFDKLTTTAALRGQGCRIIGNTAGGTLTVTAVTTAPVNTDTGEIV